MKKNIKLLLFLTIISISCENNDEVFSDENGISVSNKSEVIDTYDSKLPKNVTKIEKVTSKHPILFNSSLISKKLNSESFKSNENENAIYYFENNYYATLSYDGLNVYATVFDLNDLPIDNLVADFSEIESNKVIKIKYINTGITEIINIGSSSKSWGSCMSDAVDELYDDWEDEPVATFSCWLTGPLCVIGGGIACGIQQI